MGTYTIVLPDVGEGIAEAEITEWDVKIGDVVKEDDVLGAVMTDKAAVEIPSIVSGTITWLTGDIGDTVSVGGAFVKLEVLGQGNEKDISLDASGAAKESPNIEPEEGAQSPKTSAVAASIETSLPEATPPRVRRAVGDRPLASPAVRKRALDEGVDLRRVAGSGPAGRISHQDLEDFLLGNVQSSTGMSRHQNTDVQTIKIVGVRRKIAEKMALANARIPHITIVEEVDVTNLEELRAKLNEKHKGDRNKLSVLPFMMRAIVEAVREKQGINAHFDDEAGILHQHGGVYIGIATHTSAGLTVPVVRHVEALTLWESAGEVLRLADLARQGKATRDELTGSTITITSLGAMGAVATTPIINHPEVAIVGINKMAMRPIWDGQQFQPRKMMNISCSFDHRVIDGWDAAVFVQKLKTLLETPAMLFVES